MIMSMRTRRPSIGRQLARYVATNKLAAAAVARTAVLVPTAALVLLSLVLLQSGWSTSTVFLLGSADTAGHVGVDRPTVLVVECGRQAGYTVAESLLATEKFVVRGHSQEYTSGRCNDLVPRGLELVSGNLNEAGALTPALKGASAAFLVTSLSGGASPDDETVQGFHEIDAVLDAGVRHVVFSSLIDVALVSNGRYHIEYFTGKHQIEDRLELERRSNRLDSLSLVYPGYYFQSYSKWTPLKQGDGSFVFLYPVDPAQVTLCSIDINDLGPIVAAMFQSPSKFDGAKVLAASECPTITQIIQLMGQVTGNKVSTRVASEAECLKAGMPPHAIELLNFLHDYGVFGKQVVGPLARQLHPTMTSVESFLRTNQDWRRIFN